MVGVALVWLALVVVVFVPGAVSSHDTAPLDIGIGIAHDPSCAHAARASATSLTLKTITSKQVDFVN